MSHSRYTNKLKYFNMVILEELTKKQEEIISIHSVAHEKTKEFVSWCQKNSKEIKRFFPKKDQLYQVTDLKEAYKGSWPNLNLDEVYYFKPAFVSFRPHLDFYGVYRVSMPTVQGVLLNCNFVECSGYSTIEIIYLKEPDFNKSKQDQDKVTNIYLMIDKNTGYYKIGRSINPTLREKTLQSEKPTVELLFSYPAKVVDEKHLHTKFQDKRVRGEWFDLSGSDIYQIKTYFDK